MSQKLELEVIPVGTDEPSSPDHNLGTSQSCAAALYRSASDWEKSSLEIKWNASERYFSVEFKGTGEITLPLAEVLSKRIPLRVTHASTCECGATLELGDYTVAVEDNDFRFQADYFCRSCKARLSAEKKGFRKLLETWITGLKRIEIQATGVGLERS